MTTGNVNVAATDFCSAMAGKPHLWKELEKKVLIHKSKGRGRIERIEQPPNSVPLIYVAFGKEIFRINSNILNNGSYQLVLPKSIAKEIGIRSVAKIRSNPLPKPQRQSRPPSLPALACLRANASFAENSALTVKFFLTDSTTTRGAMKKCFTRKKRLVVKLLDIRQKLPL